MCGSPNPGRLKEAIQIPSNFRGVVEVFPIRRRRRERINRTKRRLPLTVRSHNKHIPLKAREGAHELIVRTKFGKRRKVRTTPLDCWRIRTFAPKIKTKTVCANQKGANLGPLRSPSLQKSVSLQKSMRDSSEVRAQLEGIRPSEHAG